MEHSCHLPFTGQPLPTFYRMDPGLCSCSLKAWLWFHRLWLLSFIPNLLCLGTVYLSTSFFFFLQGAVPIPEQALFFCLKPSYLPGPSCQFQGQAWWIKLVLAIITQGWFDFLGNPLAWYCPVCVIPTNSISIGCWQMLQRVGGGCCNQYILETLRKTN